MAKVELRETVFFESSPKVDAEAGTLSDVKLLGMESRNGRKYRQKAMESAVPLYRGKKIYIDHPKRESAGEERSVRDWVGTIQDARYRDGAIYGDIRLLKTHECFAGIMEAAQEFPKDIGFSHVADGESKFEGDTEIVESIKAVFSTDLVTDPATTAGFFESKNRGNKKASIKAAIESLPESEERTKLSRFIEMMDASYLDGAATGNGDMPTDPHTQLAALCRELVQQLGEALKALASKSDAPPPPVVDPLAQTAPEDDMANEPDLDPKKKEQQAAFESLQRENAELKAKSLLLESNREATAIRVKALARETDEAARKELLESWPIVAGDERPQRSPAAITESERDLDYEFSDPQKFAARYR